MKQGWLMVLGASKEHYFGADGLSLCNKWGLLRDNHVHEEPPAEEFTCKACERKWLKQKEE